MSASVTVSQLRNHLSTPALLVDVRSGTEFASGHIPGAVNIPMDEIEARLDEMQRTGAARPPTDPRAPSPPPTA